MNQKKSLLQFSLHTATFLTDFLHTQYELI